MSKKGVTLVISTKKNRCSERFLLKDSQNRFILRISAKKWVVRPKVFTFLIYYSKRKIIFL